MRQDVLELLLFLTKHLALSFRVSDILLHCANHVLALLEGGLKGTYLEFVERGFDVAGGLGLSGGSTERHLNFI